MFKIFPIQEENAKNMDGAYNMECIINNKNYNIDVIGIQFFSENDDDYSCPYFWSKDTPEYRDAITNVKQESYFSSGQHCGTFTDLNQVKKNMITKYRNNILTYDRPKVLISQFKARNTDCNYKTSMLEEPPTSIYLFNIHEEGCYLVKEEGEDFFTDDDIASFNLYFQDIISTLNRKI